VKLLAKLQDMMEKLGGVLEEGWKVQLIRRMAGGTAGTFDAYYFSPNGKRFRSRNEVARFHGFEVQPPAKRGPSEKKAPGGVRGPGACGRPRIVWHHVKGWPCWPAEELPAKLWQGGAASLEKAGLELPAPCLGQKRKPEAVLLQYFGSGDFGWAPPETLKEYEAGLAVGLADKSKSELFQRAVEQAKGRRDGTLPFAKENPSLPKWWDTPPPWSPPPSLEEKENAGPPPWKQGLAGRDAEPYRQRLAWPSDLWDLPADTFKIPAEIQVMQPPKFRGLRKNVWHESLQRPKRLPTSEIEQCTCTLNSPCDGNCLNRSTFIRCSSLCPCGDKCQNREFSLVKTPKLKRFLTTNGCGWAVRAGEAITRGQFVVEYCGEVVDDVECERRMWEARRVGEPNFYMMQISNNLVIDAREMGNMARLINSSCDPNCRAEVWTDAATLEQRVGIFALRDIAEGEEVTYDYHFQHFDIHNKTAASFKCRCGAANCRGTLDSNPERVRDFGREIEVQWNDEKFYSGTVKSFDVGSNQHTIAYAGGQVEKVDLRVAKHKWLTGGREGQPPITKDGEALALKKRGEKRRKKRGTGRLKKIAKKIAKPKEESVLCESSPAVKVESDKENNAPGAKPEPAASAPRLATAA